MSLGVFRRTADARPVPVTVPPDWRGTLRLLRAGSLALPLALLLIWGWWSWHAERAHARDEALANAELMREYALRVVQAQDGVLALVEATLAAAERENLTPLALHQRLATLDKLPGAPLSAGYVTPEGRLAATTRRYPVTVDVSDRAYFKTLRDDPSPALRVERVTLRPSGQDVLLFVRRRPGPAFAGLVFSTVPAETFTRFFARIADAPDEAASLVRADGLLLLRHRPEDPPLRLQPNAGILRAAALGDHGTFVTRAEADGVSRIYGFARLEGQPLFVNYGIGVGAMWERWMASAAPVATLLALAALLGWFAVDRAIRALAAEEARRAADARAEAARRDAGLRDSMLAELHHRVKNSLSLVQALARLPGAGPGTRVLDARVLALAKAHDLLHVTQFGSRLDLAGFLRALCAAPEIAPQDGRVTVEVDAEPLEADVERATPLALIVAELVGNAVRHAFPDGRPGHVQVSLRRPALPGGLARLTVRDDGIGMPPRPRAARGRSGLDLTEVLAGQIGGRVEHRAMPGGGTEVTLTLPIAPPA
jgi:two-component sensor histidine kinase